MAGKRVIPLTIAQVQYIAVSLAHELFVEFKEPIPPFETRYPHVLESCIQTPFMRFGRRDAYPGLIRKAAMLFYLLIKGHPFLNGNKRIAITSLMCFLATNGKWVKIRAEDFYELARWVAASKQPEEKDLAINTIEGTLRRVVVTDDEFSKYISDPSSYKMPKIKIP